jgi:CDP-glucose 4,6-dehydratase
MRSMENMVIDKFPWCDRPVFLTGATGLLGGWLAHRLLDHGADIVCLVRDRIPQCEFMRAHLADRVKVVQGDVRDRELIERILAEYEIKSVFHVAAQAVVGIANQNPISTLDSNIRGTWNVLEACRRSPSVEAVLVASSDKAYGEQKDLPYTEDCRLEGRHPYSVSKSCADLIAQSYAATFSLPVAITRCGNFYGGGDLNWNRIVPGTIRSILRGQRPVIRSDGNYVRDYIYAIDAAAAYMLLAEQLAANPAMRGLAFNFSNEIRISVLELVNLILEEMGSSLHPEIRNDASHEIRAQYLSAERARLMLGWKPLFTLHEGLRETIRWYRDFLL